MATFACMTRFAKPGLQLPIADRTVAVVLYGVAVVATVVLAHESLGR